MADLRHSFTIDPQKCAGRLACMRACPTHAIRVVDGQAQLLSELCIDCGACLSYCPSGAIQATTQSFADLDRFKYKVAVPSPVLFAQFPIGITPAHIVAGLRKLGFDAVWCMAVELALVNRATREYVEKWDGPYPLISVACPVIVRLVQVLYPRMVDQLVHVQLPREVAAREAKRKYSEELGIGRDEIATIYLTPCQAKTISILEPAEGVKSNLDGALGISDIYNDVLALTHALDKEITPEPGEKVACTAAMLRWVTGKGQVFNLAQHHYMSVTGLTNVIQVFEDVYKGKLRNIEYLECHGCWGGCVGGNLAVDNVYVTRTKIHRLTAEFQADDSTIEAEVERRYPNEDLRLGGQLRPRATERGGGDLKARVKRIKTEENILKALPGLDCGLCGTPTCKIFAKDVAAGSAGQNDCVFLSDERLEQLRKTYMTASRQAIDRDR